MNLTLRLHLYLAAVLVMIECALVAPANAAPGNSLTHLRGEAIYKKLCVDCHGPRGQGVDEKADGPLVGDRSVAWLTKRIERTMPEDAEDKCVGADAAAVARYIYDAFYSPAARADQLSRSRPQLQHLTARQHRRTLADLVSAFRNPRPLDDRRGLQAEFFKSRKMVTGERLIDRVDPTVDFRFHEKHPLRGKVDPKGFSARWRGSLIAPETGEYEIVVRSDQAVRLYLNHDSATGGGQRSEFDETLRPLIDGWVRSADTIEYRARILLLGGRAYPLVLDFSSHNQGVGDKRQHKKNDEATSYVSLGWKPPGGVETIIPSRNLAPVRSREVFVLTADFPADDRSYGFERGVSVSPQWLGAVTDAAVETAGYVADHADELAGSRPGASDRPAIIRAFAERFVALALRRPLDADSRKRFIDAPFAAAGDDVDAGLKHAVLMALSSPRFLYPEAGVTKPDSYAVASRLALAMWDSLPDEALLKAAERGELTDPARVRAHARRMLNDPRTATKLRGFFNHWLELDRAENIAKDKSIFPDYDDRLLADLRVSLDLFLRDVVASEKSDYRQLLLADYLYLNDRLRKVYGGSPVGEPIDGFARVRVNQHQRSGVITHPYLLSAFAYHNSTSPIHRGVFLTRNVVGRHLKPPPKAISLEGADFEPNLTMREKVTRFTRDSACMSCHATINPLGFSLEHYDGIGRWRDRERDKPIDATSDFIGDDGGTVKLRGPRDVAQFAIASTPARRGFVRQMFQHLVKQDTTAFGPGRLDRLEAEFAKNEFHIRHLVADIATVAATHGLD